MGSRKPVVFVAVSILSLLIALAPPAFAQRGGGGGGGRQGGGGPGGGAPPGGGGGGGGGGGRQGGGGAGAPGRPVGPGGPGYGGGRPVYGGGRYPYYGYGYRYPGYGYRYYGYYGYPYAYGWPGYPYFSASFGWGYPYGYPYYYGYGYGGGAAYDASASLRLDVTPKEAEVYVDGYMVGTVDEFDGTFQRLHLPPGAHELTLYRDGFKTVHQSLRLSTGSTFKVSYNMEPLAAGEVAEARPTPPPPPPDEAAGLPEGRPDPQAPRRRPPVARDAAGFGTLAIRVQPADAVVLIDGERWQSSGLDRLIVEVPEGPHRIEIRKDGFDTYTADVTAMPGQTVPVNVSLGAGR